MNELGLLTAMLFFVVVFFVAGDIAEHANTPKNDNDGKEL